MPGATLQRGLFWRYLLCGLASRRSLTGTATGRATVTATGETIVGKLSLTHGRGGQKEQLHRYLQRQERPTFKLLTLTYKGIYK